MKGTVSTQAGLFTLGILVVISAFCAIAVRFSQEHKTEERRAFAAALQLREMNMQKTASEIA
jgi:NNP family nitrate/nitrite transporter-like MFS transporter